MAYHFRNLIFEGGGVKGIAYVGALEVLEKKGILDDVVRVGGASAGAINALLVGLGYTVPETRRLLWDLDFNNFLDDTWGFIRDAKRLVEDYGWYKGEFFRQWVGEVIRKKTGNPEATFHDVRMWRSTGIHPRFKGMYFIGTNVSTGFAEVFSEEHTPRMPLADAVRISMSIPLFFAARKSVRGDVYVDGGMLDNYPIKLFDRKKYVEKHALETRPYYVDHNAQLKRDISRYVFNQESLGFRLDSEREIAVFRDQAEPVQHGIGDFFDYVSGLVRTLLNAQQSVHLHSDDWHRTIYIDTLGVGTTDFSLDDKTKRALVKSGKTGTAEYFDWFDDLDHEIVPWNRPRNE